MATRKEMWERLGGSVDLLVIGGGINGAGIARDAARRGLSVAVVEMGDLATGTSSRSSKLVHGGLRYLEQLEFSLVFEAVSERRILLDIAPHLVDPLGFVFPVYRGDRRSLRTIGAGMVLYEGLSLFRSPKRHRKLSPAQLADEVPPLRQDGLTGAQLYYDCSTDDARLTLETALDAVHVGAVVVTYAKASELRRDDDGRITGVVIQDVLSGETKEVQAGAVVNATGPWTDLTLRALGSGGDKPLLRTTKGIHFVISQAKLPLPHAVVCFHPDDGRILFAIPWGDATYVGTTDTDFEGDPADCWADRDDVDYLLACLAHYFPEHPLTDEDVQCTWAGLRPLMRPVAKNEEEVDESAVSREHQVVVAQDGMITIAGGKLTTYRLMSKEVVDTAVKLLKMSGTLTRKLADPRTDEEPLPGAVNWPEDDNHAAVAARIEDVGGGRVDDRTARLLADTYGMRGADVARLTRREPGLARPLVQGRPEIEAQVVWAVHNELAATVSDVMVRRTQLYYRAADQGLKAARAVGEIMGRLLDWDAAEVERQVAAYADEVGRSRAWRSQAPTPKPEPGEAVEPAEGEPVAAP